MKLLSIAVLLVFLVVATVAPPAPEGGEHVVERRSFWDSDETKDLLSEGRNVENTKSNSIYEVKTNTKSTSHSTNLRCMNGKCTKETCDDGKCKTETCDQSMRNCYAM